MDKAVIYKLTAPNGKVYIGQTIHFKRRMSNYKKGTVRSRLSSTALFVNMGSIILKLTY